MAASALDLDTFLGLARLEGLVLRRDGRQLVATVAELDADAKEYTSALWAIDPGGGSPRRLTRSTAGEAGAQGAPDGSIVFLSARPDPGLPDEERERLEDARGVWRLPPGGGEAEPLARPPGGADAVRVARDAGTVVFAAGTHPATAGWEEDAAKERARKDAGVQAQLFEDYPLRFWARWLGPRRRRLFVLDADGSARDLAPAAGGALEEASFDVTPDGGTVVTGWWREAEDPRDRALDLVAIDVAGGGRRILASRDGHSYAAPACSPDGRRVACVRERIGDPSEPHDRALVVVDLGSGSERELAPDLDLWPTAPVWAADGSAVYCTADRRGRTVPLRVDALAGTAEVLADDGAYGSLCPAPDDAALFALRSTVSEPPRVVRMDRGDAGAAPARPLPAPGATDIGARVERLSTTAGDGTAIESWLVLPGDAAGGRAAPLVLFIHGGPLSSWTGWHWRWNPHLLAARGYAVLLPDPALSTGYGQDFLRRGWGRWGAEPYTDLMTAVDAACARDDVDGERTAAMGGSFGGYMANWIAGHSDRFLAIVTHASLWSLESFHGTTDLGVWWEREFGDPYEDPSRYRDSDPRAHVGEIRTPMLVIHGELDYRVPVSEALTLWTDLARHGVDAKFLYFPDEHHWVAKPRNIRLWYETVLAFLDHHVRGEAWRRPELL